MQDWSKLSGVFPKVIEVPPIVRIVLVIIGAGLIVDGIGSIVLQEKQPWYWQFERAVRSVAGIIVLLIGLIL